MLKDASVERGRHGASRRAARPRATAVHATEVEVARPGVAVHEGLEGEHGQHRPPPACSGSPSQWSAAPRPRRGSSQLLVDYARRSPRGQRGRSASATAADAQRAPVDLDHERRRHHRRDRTRRGRVKLKRVKVVLAHHVVGHHAGAGEQPAPSPFEVVIAGLVPSPSATLTWVVPPRRGAGARGLRPHPTVRSPSRLEPDRAANPSPPRAASSGRTRARRDPCTSRPPNVRGGLVSDGDLARRPQRLALDDLVGLEFGGGEAVAASAMVTTRPAIACEAANRRLVDRSRKSASLGVRSDSVSPRRSQPPARRGGRLRGGEDPPRIQEEVGLLIVHLDAARRDRQARPVTGSTAAARPRPVGVRPSDPAGHCDRADFTWNACSATRVAPDRVEVDIDCTPAARARRVDEEVEQHLLAQSVVRARGSHPPQAGHRLGHGRREPRGHDRIDGVAAGRTSMAAAVVVTGWPVAAPERGRHRQTAAEAEQAGQVVDVSGRSTGRWRPPRAAAELGRSRPPAWPPPGS